MWSASIDVTQFADCYWCRCCYSTRRSSPDQYISMYSYNVLQFQNQATKRTHQLFAYLETIPIKTSPFKNFNILLFVITINYELSIFFLCYFI